MTKIKSMDFGTETLEWPPTAQISPVGLFDGLTTSPVFSTGIVVSEPTNDPILVRSQLDYFYATYPGQLFTLDSSEFDGSKVMISWLPSWLAPMWASGLLYRAFSLSFTWAPWPIR